MQLTFSSLVRHPADRVLTMCVPPCLIHGWSAAGPHATSVRQPVTTCSCMSTAEHMRRGQNVLASAGGAECCSRGQSCCQIVQYLSGRVVSSPARTVSPCFRIQAEIRAAAWCIAKRSIDPAKIPGSSALHSPRNLTLGNCDPGYLDLSMSKLDMAQLTSGYG